MARRGRQAARLASASIRNSLPAAEDFDDDEEMADAPNESQTQSQNEGDDADAEATSPAQESENNAEEEAEEVVSDASAPRVYRINQPRRRRPGRPPKIRPPEPDRLSTPGDDGSDRGTPRGRRRGRPYSTGRGGFRGRPRGSGRGGGPVLPARVPVDKEGNMMDVVNDEVELPDDPEGETKVDKNGCLLGGREYRVRTFTLLGREDRLYMLSTEPARCTGFRDSYLFFTKHMYLYKIIIGEDEKRDLIERDLIPHSYKGRAIGVVTARSVFREFGALIVVGGRRIIDDYNAAERRAQGEVEGELVDPNDKLPPPGEPYNKNQYVAWHGASSVYHQNPTSLPSVIMNGLRPGVPTNKRKPNITSANWQVEHARDASRFNSELAAQRRLAFEGVYEPHTNIMLVPRILQPTHAKWERIPVPSSPPTSSSSLRSLPSRPAEQPNQHAHTNGINGIKGTALTNGTSSPHHPSDRPSTSHSNSHPHDTDRPQSSTAHSAKPTRFPTPSSRFAANYLIVDTHYVSPMHPTFPLPGPDGPNCDVGFTTGLPQLDEEDIAEMPVESQVAYRRAWREQEDWRSEFAGETENGARGTLKIGTGLGV